MTQIEQLDAHFRNGGTLTTLEAMLPPFNCCSLSQRAGDLYGFGKPIISEWVKLPSGKRVKRYRYVMIGETAPLC